MLSFFVFLRNALVKPHNFVLESRLRGLPLMGASFVFHSKSINITSRKEKVL
jgi:hypothetical protein